MDFPNPEIGLAAVLLLVAILAARRGWRWPAWWERPLARLARRKRLAILIAVVAPLALRAALLPLYPIPQPHVQDEFSFLLGADTFAHGRVANPRHPMWVHFESMHIFARPAYASAFPAAPALAMAAGQAMFGHPWAGVWLSGGFLCGAICWMLQGWLPARWALLGAFLAILRFGVSSYWMNSYWGGFMAAAGGALVLGALPRIMRRPHWGHAAVLAAGLAILANSRPFEGLVLAILAAVWLFAWMFGRKAPPPAVLMRKVVIPMVLVLAPVGAAMSYDFARITGKAWMLPYLEFRDTTTMAPHFIWMKPGPQPLYDNRQMRNFYVDWELLCYRVSRTPFDLLRKLVYWRFYIGPLLTLPLLALPALWRDRKARPLIRMAAGFSLVLVAQVWHNIHYAAPVTGLAILIVLLGMRRLQLWRPGGQPVGRYLVRGLPAACLAMFVIQIAAGPFAANGASPATWRWPEPLGLNRVRVLKQLLAVPGKHLVLVRYSAAHDPGDEWVYNRADIDGSQVVWARELDRTSNRNLLRYFSGRSVWLVEPDGKAPHLEPYGDAPARLMAFVQLGAPGIDVLRSVDEVRRRVLAEAGADGSSVRTCDVWNFEFSASTGVEGPDVGGCFAGAGRGVPVPFDHWFEWLKRQK